MLSCIMVILLALVKPQHPQGCCLSLWKIQDKVPGLGERRESLWRLQVPGSSLCAPCTQQHHSRVSESHLPPVLHDQLPQEVVGPRSRGGAGCHIRVHSSCLSLLAAAEAETHLHCLQQSLASGYVPFCLWLQGAAGWQRHQCRSPVLLSDVSLQMPPAS